jgi:AraC-like DNA-binding protein
LTYEPSVAVVVQGRKRVDLGRTTFIYDASRFLLTSVDLPVTSQIIEASEARPYLCLRLKLEMHFVRELLSRLNYAKALRVEDLAQIAGMGVSTLHHHFRALTAMSPLQYQKQLRLHAARGRMLVDGLDAASAAFEVGYESAGQFNREYSRFFGRPPIRDVRTLRSSSAPGLQAGDNQNAI